MLETLNIEPTSWILRNQVFNIKKHTIRMTYSFVDMDPPVWTDPPLAEARLFLFRADFTL